MVPDGVRIVNDEMFRLSPAHLETFWGAVIRSTRSRPCWLRQQVRLFGTVHVSEHFIDTLTDPRMIVGVLEDLVREGTLRRDKATAIEDALFAQVTPEGCWQGNPPASAPGGGVWAPDVQTLAMVGSTP